MNADFMLGPLRRAGLDSFDAFWSLPRNWFEEPNRRGQGWSGVSRHELGQGLAVFVKRQQNYFLGRRRVSSFEREARNIRRLAALGVPVAPMVFFHVEREADEVRAVLALKALDEYRSLHSVMADWRAGAGDFRQRRRAARAIAEVVARLHAARLSFNALYPKHIYLHGGWLGGGEARLPVRLIDLERVRRRLLRRACAFQDLETLNRHCAELPATVRLRFYLAYRGRTRLGPSDKRLLKRIARRSERKRRRREISNGR